MNYKIISKFIKDISFEIPNAKAYVMLEKEIANYNLNFDIKSSPFKDKIIEVSTILRINPNQEIKNKILFEINYTSLVSIEEDFKNKKEIEKIVLIKIPTEVYPTIYEIFKYLFSQAGIKNIQIDKEVDFEKMYAQRKK